MPYQNHKYISEEAIYEQWVFGFITAINADNLALHVNRKSSDVDTAGTIFWIRAWCQTHPDHSLIEAAIAFMTRVTK